MISLIGCAFWLDWAAIPDDRRSLFIFLAMLPIFNALFDVLSYALTLSLVRYGLNSSRPWVWGLVDLALAFVLLLALGATLVIVIHGLNLLAGVPFIDLSALFGGIHDRPSDYFWLYLMLFSTLLPTGLHALISLISLQGWAPRWLRATLGSWINQASESPLYAIGASFALGVVWAVPVAGAITLVWFCLHFGWDFLSVIGEWYFKFLLHLAAIPIGAI